MSTVKADNFTWKSGQSGGLTGTNVTGDQIVYGVAKSWIQFVCPSGTLSTSASYNVSSVTRSGAGQFYIDFATSMRDSGYAVAAAIYNGQSNTGFSNSTYIVGAYAMTSGRCYFNTPSGSVFTDLAQYGLIVNR